MDHSCRQCLGLFFCILLPGTAPGTIISIPSDYDTIQDGIDAAQNADTLLVADGTYYENVNFKGHNIVVASEFILDQDYSHILHTIIDGSMYTIIDSASCVAFVSGEDSSAVIQGFTLTGGRGTTYDLKNINPNWQAFTQEGGGVFLDQSSATIRDNLIINNEVPLLPGYDFSGGGGISSFVGNPQICNNVIMLNNAGYACGLVLNWSGGIVKNNIIYGNYGGEIEGAGGIMIWDVGPASQVVENNTVVYNISALTAGGIFNWNTASIIRNNIIWGNEQQSGQQVTGYETAIFEYCNTQEEYPGQGNISVDPDFDSGNFLLDSTSLCIDAGNPGVAFRDVEDPDNPGFALFPSLGGLRNDMGAYGGPGALLLPDFEYLGAIEDDCNSPISASLILRQNYPNPFSLRTTIQYALQQGAPVTLTICNALGQQVRTLVHEQQAAGNKSIVWDGKDDRGVNVNSGVYLCKIAAGDVQQTRTMTLLK